MQRRDITVTDEHLGILANNAVIQPGKQTRSAITTAQADDAPDSAISEHIHQICSPFSIGTRQETPPAMDIAPQLWPEPKLVQSLDRELDVLRVRWRAGRRDDADTVAAL